MADRETAAGLAAGEAAVRAAVDKVARPTRVLHTWMVDSPRFIGRDMGCQTYGYRWRVERAREPGSWYPRIEDDVVGHFRQNWIGALPPILIFGDQPDDDEVQLDTLIVANTGAGTVRHVVGLASAYLTETVEIRIRFDPQARPAALAILRQAAEISARTTRPNQRIPRDLVDL